MPYLSQSQTQALSSNLHTPKKLLKFGPGLHQGNFELLMAHHYLANLILILPKCQYQTSRLPRDKQRSVPVQREDNYLTKTPLALENETQVVHDMDW